MADDIDIEEHDILDNPHIRNIFPDLSVVKKEISEYFNEAVPVKQLVKQETDLSESISPQQILNNEASSNNIKSHQTIENKSLQKQTISSANKNSPADSIKKLETSISFQKNKIIIGSKPNRVIKNGSETREKNQIRHPKIFLHDVRTNLEKSKRYCKECRILFAEKSKLKEHELIKHSTPKRQILTRTRFDTKNKANENFAPLTRRKKSDENDLKSIIKQNTSKSMADESDKPLTKMDISNESEENINSITRSGSFKTTNDYVKPSTSSDTSSNEEDEDVEMPLMELNSSDSSEDEAVVESLCKLDVPRCRICHIRVANRGNLVRHYKAIHRKKLKIISKETTDKSIRNSNDKVPSPKSHNISNVKSINKTKDTRDSSNLCKVCNIKFCSIYSLNRHNRNVHRSRIESSPVKIKIDQRVKDRGQATKNTRNTISDAENKKCFHCNKEFPDNKSLIEHVYLILEPKKTRNSDRIMNKIEEQGECNVENKKSLDAINEPSNKTRPEKNKTTNNAINSNKKRLKVRNETSSRKKLRSANAKTSKVAVNIKKRLEARNKTTKKVYLNRAKIKTKNNALKSNEKRIEANNKLHNKNCLRPAKNKINNNVVKINGKENNSNLLYVCPHCTFCFLTVNNYFKHIINRHGTKVSKINRQSFNPQCKYCSYRSTSKLYYNRHLSTVHLDILKKKVTSKIRKVPKSVVSVNDKMLNSKAFAFKSAVFKCGRCDIHFVSSETARDHTVHMEFLINWKCPICDIIFKKTDEKMHLLQHLSSEHIEVHEFSSEALSNLLYNCTKCAIHFSEKKYIEHYEQCEKETAESTYCKACDILINDADAKIHSTDHNQNEDYTLNVITSDIIFDDESNSVNKPNSKNITKIKKPNTQSGKPAVNYNVTNETLTYCPTCQCYMTLVHKIHLKKQCTQLIKHVCVDCGLLLTNKCIDTHRKYHRMKALTMQDFKFTDLQGNYIKPAIPEYPQCKICKVYFVNKLGINGHVCSEYTDISSCDICKIKLSSAAFKLHMCYHNYSLQNENGKTAKVKKHKVFSNDVHAAKNITATTSSTSGPVEKSSTSDSNETQNLSIIKIDPNVAVLFSCKSCFITLNNYDKLIEHCQNHPSVDKAQSLILKACNICNLKFDFPTYKIHNEIHAHNLTIKNFTVDIKYFGFDRKVWLNHVFQNLNPKQLNEIIGKSIYQNEHRVRFKILQSGPPDLTIYKCDKCSLFFDHETVFKHSNCKNVNIRGTSCASCGLKFLSGALRNQHLKIHMAHGNINEKSYRIVIFNQASDEVHSNVVAQPSQFIIYQCRNCNGVIEKSANHKCNINNLKKCNECGLLIYKDKFKSHCLDHKNSIYFEPDNIKVILLGTKEEKADSDILVPHPSFKGLIYDYTLYQCKHCEICVKNDLHISNHVCVFGIYRSQCQKCDLFFNSKGYNHHLKTHNVDPDFNKENIHIVQFDLKSNNDVKESTTNDEEKYKKTEHKVNIESAKIVVLYKCKCGLHFVDKCKGIKHVKQCNPKIKSYKQNCTKCSLLFNPSELFSHLVNHHGDKNQLLNYDVKEISEENIEEFEKVILFNCSKCGLHYLDKIIANDHYKSCNGEVGDFEECTKCKIVYDKSSFVLDKHNESCENKFEIEIIDNDDNNTEVTANVDLSQKCENVATQH